MPQNFKTIDQPFVIEMIDERFDNISIMLTDNALVYGSSITSIMSGLPANGDLDIASLKQYAQDIGLDTTSFNECLDSGEMASEVQKDFQDGQSYGVSGTPTFSLRAVKAIAAVFSLMAASNSA